MYETIVFFCFVDWTSACIVQRRWKIVHNTHCTKTLILAIHTYESLNSFSTTGRLQKFCFFHLWFAFFLFFIFFLFLIIAYVWNSIESNDGVRIYGLAVSWCSYVSVCTYIVYEFVFSFARSIPTISVVVFVGKSESQKNIYTCIYVLAKYIAGSWTETEWCWC